MFKCQSCVRKSVQHFIGKLFLNVSEINHIYMIKPSLNFNSFDINNFVSKIILSTIQSKTNIDIKNTVKGLTSGWRMETRK